MKQAVLLSLILVLAPLPLVARQTPASTPRPAHAAPPAPQALPPPARRELGKWWKNSEIVQQLALTPAQISQIESTFLDYRLKLIDLRADLERQETKLQPLIEADQPDDAKVGAQIDLVVAARGRLEKSNTMMMLAIRRALNPDQWKKLQSIMEERGVHRAPAPFPAHARPLQPEPPHAPAAPRPPDHLDRPDNEEEFPNGLGVAPAPVPNPGTPR